MTRIERLYIEGYGIFSGFELGPLEQLTVVVGPNESGKTTLLSFVRSVIFGFPDRRSGENQYLPLAGGRQGGRVVLTDNAGQRHTVERFAGRRGGAVVITCPDGSLGDTTLLEVLLGHATRDLFRNVFAFSLQELQEFSTLASEELRARIYSAGLGAGRLAVADAERALTRRQGELFRDRGTAQPLNTLLQKLEEVERELRQIGEQAGRHELLQREVEHLREQIATLRTDHHRVQEQLHHVQNLAQAWEDWVEVNAAREQIEQLRSPRSFPEDGIGRLETLLERRRGLKDSLERLRQRQITLRSDLGGINVNEALLRETQIIEQLRRGLHHYESARSDLPQVKADRTHSLADLEGTLRSLGPGWNIERVKDFDTSIPRREEVRAHRDALAAARQGVHDTERDLAQASLKLKEARNQEERYREQLAGCEEPLERDPQVLEARRRAARDLREHASALNLTKERRVALREREADLIERQAALQQQLALRDTPLPVWPATALFLLAGAIGGWLMLRGQVLAALAALAFLSILSGGYLLLRRLLARSAKERPGLLQTELEVLGSRLGALRDELQGLEIKLAEETRQAEALAQLLGLPPSFQPEELVRIEQELEAQALRLTEWRQQQQRLKELQELVAGAEEMQAEAHTAYEKAAVALADNQNKWRQWLQQHQLEEQLTPDGCLEVFSALEAGREKLKALGTLDERIADMTATVSNFEAEAMAAAERSGIPMTFGANCSNLVDTVAEALTQAQKDVERRGRLQDELRQTLEEFQRTEKTLEAVQTEMAELFAAGEAKDEEQFRERARLFGEGLKLEATVRERSRNLERIAGHGQDLERFVGSLRGSNPQQLRQQDDHLTGQIGALQQELEEKQRTQGDLGRQIAEIEQEERFSELALERSVLRQQLEAAVSEWSVLTIALRLVRETRERYERERQPAVIQEAHSFFGRVTGGRYQRILAPIGEQRIQVEDRNGARKGVSELSRGTAEQLYLALRFGLIREFGRRSACLPVILDDILVNFDPERAIESCRALVELSTSHQVILFTCHPDTAHIIREAEPHTQVVSL